jgi:restriction system protein
MVARSIEKRIAGLLLSSFGVALISLAILVSIVREYPLQIAAIAVAAFAAWTFLNSRSQSAREENWRSAVAYTDGQIDNHRSALISYFRQSIKRDLFGNEETQVWDVHLTKFVETQVAPGLIKQRIDVDERLMTRLKRNIDEQIRIDASRTMSDFALNDVSQLSGVEYEAHCAEILRRSGWTVYPTPATGDHGADIVAEKNGKRLVVQCKQYGQPVGNKAVQEVYSARPMYHAANACVVAPAGFTAHAKRAAHALSVRLLDHRDLEAFADEVSA